MNYDFSEHELPMQPGEASWASWKCGGGPHKDDTQSPEAAWTEAKISAVVLSYAGCESAADLPRVVLTPSSERANLPG